MKNFNQVSCATSLSLFRHLRKDMGTGAEMCPAMISGVVTGNAPPFKATFP